MRKKILCFMVLLTLLCAAPVLAVQSGPFSVAISWTDSPKTTITAVWRDNTARDEVLEVVDEAVYEKSGFVDAVAFPAICKDISLDHTGIWHYEATAEGLKPGTRYCYRVGQEGAWSAIRRFQTDASDATTVAFAYMGDAQPANDTEVELALWGELTQAMYERNPELSFAILGGDIVNSGISVPQFDAFFRYAEPVFSQVPLFSAVGNHESNFLTGKAELFLDWFAFPKNGPAGFSEEIFSFDVANCHILVLNDWIFSGEQRLTAEDYASVNRWIAADLAGSTADWQIAVLHVPVYALHDDSTADKVLESWGTIFEQYGVDLVFEGHQHVYSRSYPLYQGKIDYENGIPYIMGVSGSKFYDSADETLAEKTIYNTATYELVQIDGDTMTVCALDLAGNELDFVNVRQRGIECTYTDVPVDAPYAQAVCSVTSEGLFNGVGEGRFYPDGMMTRGMFTTVLHRYAGLPETEQTKLFTDVPSDRWYAEAINWAAAEGVVQGIGDSQFRPDETITLEQMAVILYRYDGSAAAGEASDIIYGDISLWAMDAMNWAVNSGLLDGVSGLPVASAPVTRAQAAMILMRFQGEMP